MLNHHQTSSVADDGLTYFARTNWRGDQRPFGIRDRDRLFHTYVLGRTGTGKSTLLENFLMQDLKRGHGCCLIDPHGDLAERVLDHVPRHRIDDVVYLRASLQIRKP